MESIALLYATALFLHVLITLMAEETWKLFLAGKHKSTFTCLNRDQLRFHFDLFSQIFHCFIFFLFYTKCTFSHDTKASSLSSEGSKICWPLFKLIFYSTMSVSNKTSNMLNKSNFGDDVVCIGIAPSNVVLCLKSSRSSSCPHFCMSKISRSCEEPEANLFHHQLSVKHCCLPGGVYMVPLLFLFVLGKCGSRY